MEKQIYNIARRLICLITHYKSLGSCMYSNPTPMKFGIWKFENLPRSSAKRLNDVVIAYYQTNASILPLQSQSKNIFSIKNLVTIHWILGISSQLTWFCSWNAKAQASYIYCDY